MGQKGSKAKETKDIFEEEEEEREEDEIVLKEEELSEEEKSQLKKRLHIVTEIQSTEKSYFNGLNNIYEVYKLPLLKNKIIKKEMVEKLFGNLEELLLVHLCIFFELTQKIKKWDGLRESRSSIGSVFLRNAPALRLYTFYINRYNESLELIQKELKKNSDFAKFLATSRDNPRCEGQDLLSLLITPVQRLPRYVLLLKELHKNTKESHRDFQDVGAALQGISVVTDYVNEQKRLAEMYQELVKIDCGFTSDLPFKLAVKGRRLIKEVNLLIKIQKTIFRSYSEIHSWVMNDGVLFGKEEGGMLNFFGKNEYVFVTWVSFVGDGAPSVQLEDKDSKVLLTGAAGEEVKVMPVKGQESAFDDWLKTLLGIVHAPKIAVFSPEQSSAASSNTYSSSLGSSSSSSRAASSRSASPRAASSNASSSSSASPSISASASASARQGRDGAIVLEKTYGIGIFKDKKKNANVDYNELKVELPKELQAMIDLTSIFTQVAYRKIRQRGYGKLKEISLSYPNDLDFKKKKMFSSHITHVKSAETYFAAVNDAADRAVSLVKTVMRLFMNQVFDPDYYPLFQEEFREILFDSPSSPSSSSTSPRKGGTQSTASNAKLFRYLHKPEHYCEMVYLFTPLLHRELDEKDIVKIYKQARSELPKKGKKGEHHPSGEEAGEEHDEKTQRKLYGMATRQAWNGFLNIIGQIEEAFRSHASLTKWNLTQEEVKKLREMRSFLEDKPVSDLSNSSLGPDYKGDDEGEKKEEDGGWNL